MGGFSTQNERERLPLLIVPYGAVAAAACQVLKHWLLERLRTSGERLGSSYLSCGEPQRQTFHSLSTISLAAQAQASAECHRFEGIRAGSDVRAGNDSPLHLALQVAGIVLDLITAGSIRSRYAGTGQTLGAFE